MKENGNYFPQKLNPEPEYIQGQGLDRNMY